MSFWTFLKKVSQRNDWKQKGKGKVCQTLTLELQWYEFKPPSCLISNHRFEIIPLRDGGTWPKLVSLSKTPKKSLGGGPILFWVYCGDN